ncbi:MAG: type IV toxin-antitoxin system AbiEi family antitoxin [Pseudomonadota bacterium]
MSTNKTTKMKLLLEKHKPGTVCLAQWLVGLGISIDLQKQYCKSGWIESVGIGAFKRPDDEISWAGGLYALQDQAKLPLHVGGPTSLSLLGHAHHFSFEKELIFLFSPQKLLPKWFVDYAWQNPIQHIKTITLPVCVGLESYAEANFTIKISTAERSILECLYLTPKYISLVECYQMFEGLANLRPQILQDLLEQCTSVKIKRVFMYFMEKKQHAWVPFLDTTRVSLGQGPRTLVKGGVYIPKFKIVIPKELAEL